MANLVNVMNFESSSEEEENIVNVRRVKVYKQRRVDDNCDFRGLFRFTRNGFNFIVNYFLSEEEEDTRGGGLNSSQKMKIFLRYIGDPGFQVRIVIVLLTTRGLN